MHNRGMVMGIVLSDGFATYVGDGFYALAQNDEYGLPQSVVISIDDIAAILADGAGDGAGASGLGGR